MSRERRDELAVLAFQSLMFESALADASVVPSGEKATAVTVPACPLRVRASVDCPKALADKTTVQ